MSENKRHLGGLAWLVPLVAIVLPLFAYFASLNMKGGPQLREVAYQTDKDRGAALFNEHCVKCHGPKGEGNGPMAKNLPKPPKDLITGTWTVAVDQASLKQVIREGIPAAGMPATLGISRSDLEHLAAYTWKLKASEKQEEAAKEKEKEGKK